MVSVALFGARRTHEWLPQPRDIESHFRRILVRCFFLKLGFRLCAGQCMHGFYAVPVESNKAEQSLIMTWRACAIRISRFFRWYAERSHEGCASRKSSNNWWFWSSNAAPVCVMFRLLWPTHGLVLETWRAIGIWYLQMWLSKPDVTFLNCCEFATGRLKGFSFSLLPPTKGIGISLGDPSSLKKKGLVVVAVWFMW